mmetsp:Transcript_28543/g.98540  ORF Transcript_28543/g.98540 Transcript_28543/m.98540 type:complete len:95 (+) Transcript_28543:216-500(+)
MIYGRPFECPARTRDVTAVRGPLERPLQRSLSRPLFRALARASLNKLVFFDADIEAVKGKICQVVIREAGENSLTGELVVEKATSSSELVDILE